MKRTDYASTDHERIGTVQLESIARCEYALLDGGGGGILCKAQTKTTATKREPYKFTISGLSLHNAQFIPLGHIGVTATAPVPVRTFRIVRV